MTTDHRERTDADRQGPQDPGPVFRNCARCGYSLRGLAARHSCPECGLRFDERCALYRVRNPRQVVVLWILILGGGWVSVKNLPHLGSLASASAWQTVGALAGVLWVVFVAAGIRVMVRRWRRGFEVAVTADGLIVRLPGFTDDLIPWADIDGASIGEQPPEKAQVAWVTVRSTGKTLAIGGVVNVFPTPDDVERFVQQVRERVVAVAGEAG